MLQLKSKSAGKVIMQLGKIGAVVVVGQSKIDMHASTFSRLDGERWRSHMIIDLSTLPFGHEQKRRYVDIRVDEGDTCRVTSLEPMFSYAVTESRWNRSFTAHYLDGLGFSAAARWLQNCVFPADPQTYTVPIEVGLLVPARGSIMRDKRLVVLSNRLTPKTVKTQFSLWRNSYGHLFLKHYRGEKGAVISRIIGRLEAEKHLKVFGFNPQLLDLAF